MAADADATSQEQEASPKEIYEHLLAVLDHNTGGYQPPIHRQAPLRQMVNRGRCDPKRVKHAVEKARQNGDVFRWRSDDGTAYLGIDNADELRGKLSGYAESRDEPRKDLIAVANQRVEHLSTEVVDSE